MLTLASAMPKAARSSLVSADPIARVSAGSVSNDGGGFDLVLIHEKISALLEQRRLKKRDLARALGVSPQTATDICKGRSAITLRT